MSNPLVYGKNNTQRIVCCEPSDGQIELFIEEASGEVRSVIKPFNYWFLLNRKLNDKCIPLDGELTYKYMAKFTDKESFTRAFYKSKEKADVYKVTNAKEQAMIMYGFTYFKGMKVEDISLLSFDIETTGVNLDQESRVLLISNTFRRNGKLIRKLFSFDDYKNDGAMIAEWCTWVREMNPSLLVGHNVFKFDLPYLVHVAGIHGVKVNLGRDGSAITIANYESKFRKDGSQFYGYNKVFCYGREIVDTFFLAVKYDLARRYSSYGLKSLIKEEGLEKPGRQFYEAGSIRYKYKDPKEFALIKQYAIDDSDDALKLFDLMIGSTFYTAPLVPKSFTELCLCASGSQINSMMIRSYIQDNHSIPKAQESEGGFEGAISVGNPGIYSNCLVFDVNSLYPSIMLTYELEDRIKDPKGYFLKILKILTEERLNNKRLAKETGIRYYDDMQSSGKALINSFYGFLGAGGLAFNNVSLASKVTKHGREILQTAIKWATGEHLEIENLNDLKGKE